MRSACTATTLALLGLMSTAAATHVPAAAAGTVRIDDLTAVDTATGLVVTLDDGRQPGAATAAPGGGAARAGLAMDDGYVGCSWADDCTPFDLTSHALGASIDLLPEGNYPYDATMTLDGAEVWIPGASGDGVIVIDRATNSIRRRIAVGEYPISVVFTNDGTHALVSNRDTRDLSRIDTSTYMVDGTLDLGITSGFGPGNLALDPVSGKIYAVRYYEGTLYEIAADGTEVLDSRAIGNNLWQLVVSPDGQRIYATDRGTDQVLVVDPATLNVIQTVPVGNDPWGIDVNADGSRLVVACEDDHSAYIIDTASWVTTPLLLAADADPRDVDILDASQLAYVPGGRVGATNPVYVIDITGEAIETSFDVPSSNTNIVAVQVQMHAGSTAVAGPRPVPGVPALRSFPNPFNPATTIRFDMASPAHVGLTVYDTHGRLVVTLVDEQRAAGRHRVAWDGRDDRGQPAAGGVYLVRLATAGGTRALKVVLAR